MVLASDCDVAPIPSAVQGGVHVCRGVGLWLLFRLFKRLGVATPSELHFLDHTRRSLWQWYPRSHVDVAEWKATFNMDCHASQGFTTQEHRQKKLSLLLETRCFPVEVETYKANKVACKY